MRSRAAVFATASDGFVNCNDVIANLDVMAHGTGFVAGNGDGHGWLAQKW
jgi:hypothetical protein